MQDWREYRAPWGDEELVLLREHYVGGGAAAVRAAGVSRSDRAIHAKAMALHLQSANGGPKRQQNRAEVWAACCDEVAAELKRLDAGATPPELAAWLDLEPNRVRRVVAALVAAGRATKAPAGTRGGGGSPVWRYFAAGMPIPPPPPAPPKPWTSPMLVPCRPVPPRTEERTEMRMEGGRLVKVTIGPCVIDPPAIVGHGVSRVRVTKASQWGGL